MDYGRLLKFRFVSGLVVLTSGMGDIELWRGGEALFESII
jgi:hypothetical protein